MRLFSGPGSSRDSQGLTGACGVTGGAASSYRCGLQVRCHCPLTSGSQGTPQIPNMMRKNGGAWGNKIKTCYGKKTKMLNNVKRNRSKHFKHQIKRADML